MVLRIPESGLELGSTAKPMAALPLQAFAITLADDVLEDMIESFQNGQGIQLSLGQNPSFLYGSDVYDISRTPDSFSYDLYITDPKEPQTADLLPNPTMSLFRNPALNRLRYKGPAPREVAADEDEEDVLEIVNNPDARPKASKSKSSSLQATTTAKHKPSAKKSAVSSIGSAFSMSNSAISRASSPALSGIGSPLEPPAESASQQKVKDARELRAPVTHSLAVREMTYDELWEKWGGGEDTKKDFRSILDKVADLDKSAGKYSMKKMYYRELDIWNHSYDSDLDRQLAIDNTARWYDRMRIGASEPVWQKLLPFDERGKGKSLSKLQASLAKGPKTMTSTPKIHVQKAEDSTSGAASPGSRDDDVRSVKSLNGSEPMSRSNSQTKTTKKTTADQTAAIKKAAAGAKKAATPKVSPVKSAVAPKPGAKSTNGGRGPLSKELISDSDDSSEEVPLSLQAKQAKKQLPAAAPRPAKVSAPVRAPAVVAPKAKPSPAVKESIEPQITARPPKRARDDEDSSSSSGATPLIKKRDLKATPTVSSKEVGSGSGSGSGSAKPKAASKLGEKEKVREVKPLPTTTKQRAQEPSSSQNSSRGTTGSSSSLARPKNTSPAKSSPLASSPPTNASDVDPAEEALIANANASSGKKRKAAADSYNDSSSGGSSGGALPRVKRQQQSGSRLSEDVMDTARKFKQYYEKYEALHYQLLELENPEQSQIGRLTKMRDRLEVMKKEIYAGTRRGWHSSDSDATDRR